VATQTRVLGQASGPDGGLVTVSVDYDDAVPRVLLVVRCDNRSTVPAAVTVTNLQTGRSLSRTLGPGLTEAAVPTGTGSRIGLNGIRRGQLDGVEVDVRVPA
jgi:hypothetical protein